jgi:hypothetical protein
LEVRQWRKSGLEHPPNSVAKSSHEAVEDKFWIVGSCTGMSLVQPVRTLCAIELLKERTKICLVSSTDVSLKYAVGPFGRWTIVIASGKKQV